jgi:catechol 2,3-dioxygenase-like lactoylglutathione lyase family enzyme
MAISGLAHVNLIVPEGSLDLATEFYGTTLGLIPREVPSAQRGTLAWFGAVNHLVVVDLNADVTVDIGSSGQQVHIAFGPSEVESRRHPCFSVPSAEALLELQTKIWEHYQRRGQSASAPRQADEPGKTNSGSQGVEYPTRFFARDFAGEPPRSTSSERVLFGTLISSCRQSPRIQPLAIKWTRSRNKIPENSLTCSAVKAVPKGVGDDQSQPPDHCSLFKPPSRSSSAQTFQPEGSEAAWNGGTEPSVALSPSPLTLIVALFLWVFSMRIEMFVKVDPALTPSTEG